MANNYIVCVINKIFSDSNRDNPKTFQIYLCRLILCEWDNFVKEYKKFKGFKECKNIEECLAKIFNINYEIVESILQQLDIYKNYHKGEKNVMNDCCNVKLCLN